MNIPNQLHLQTREFVQVMTKFCLYLSKYGAKPMEDYLDSIPLRMAKIDGKHLGAYIINKICQEYEKTPNPINRFDLFSSNERREELAHARMLLCVLTHKYIHLDKTEISAMFNKSRHFAKRAIADFENLDPAIPNDRKILDKYKKLDTLIGMYVEFKPKTK